MVVSERKVIVRITFKNFIKIIFYIQLILCVIIITILIIINMDDNYFDHYRIQFLCVCGVGSSHSLESLSFSFLNETFTVYINK